MGDEAKLISEDDCAKVLQNFSKRKDLKLFSYEVGPLSATKEGFLGDHYILRINYLDEDEKKSQTFFMKTLVGTLLSELTRSLSAYEKEEFFYTVLVEEFEKYKIKTDFAPKAHMCNSDCIVLEDLRLKKFKPTKGTEPLDMEHLKVCLETLAKFHGAGIVYEERMSRDLNRKYTLKEKYSHLLEEKIFSEEENPASKWFKCTLDALFSLIDYIPKNHISPEQFREKMEETLQDIIANMSTDGPVLNTVLHGDLWSNNFLFNYEDGAPVAAKLIDYQLVKYGPPSLDVVHFLLTNTRKKFRDAYFNELLEYYYKCLREFLDERNISCKELLPKEEYLGICEEMKVPAKLQTVADRSITFLMNEDFGDYLTEENYEKFFFDDRCKILGEAMESNLPFRELILEDMAELRDMLFSS